MEHERQSRREALKSMLKELHQGKDPGTLKARFAQLQVDVSPREIGKVEQEK